MKNTKEATATLMGGGTRIATLEELAKVETPARTDTWKPIPHVDVPNVINGLVEERGWAFAEPDDRYQFTVSRLHPDNEGSQKSA